MSSRRAASGPLHKLSNVLRPYRLSRQHRLNLAMLFAGFGSFSLMYYPQPLLPVLAQHFAISPTEASLAISLTTGPMALMILIAGALGNRVHRPRLITASLLLAAALTAASAFAPSWPVLLGLRMLTGVALAGVPAVAMTHIAAETKGPSLGAAMGIYVAGTAIGGMTGRLGANLAADILGWRSAIGLVGLSGMVLAALFTLLLPASLKIQGPRPTGVVEALRAFQSLLADRVLLLLFLTAFLLMGAFVSVYNYAAFHLLTPPFLLSQTAIGLIFSLYLLGGLGSASFGWLAGRVGRGKTLWIPLVLLIFGVAATVTLSTGLFILAIGFVTIGFFGAHSIASSWVGARTSGEGGRGAALYLFFYYLGSAVLSSLGGLVWESGGWSGIVLYVTGLCTTALVVAVLAAREAGIRT